MLTCQRGEREGNARRGAALRTCGRRPFHRRHGERGLRRESGLGFLPSKVILVKSVRSSTVAIPGTLCKTREPVSLRGVARTGVADVAP